MLFSRYKSTWLEDMRRGGVEIVLMDNAVLEKWHGSFYPITKRRVQDMQCGYFS
jgi:hypothetical protein